MARADVFRHARGWTDLSRGHTHACVCTQLRACRSGIAARSTGRVRDTHAAVRDVGKRGDGQRDRHGAGNCTDAAPVRTLSSWCSHERLLPRDRPQGEGAGEGHDRKPAGKEGKETKTWGWGLQGHRPECTRVSGKPAALSVRFGCGPSEGASEATARRTMACRHTGSRRGAPRCRATGRRHTRRPTARRPGFPLPSLLCAVPDSSSISALV